MEGRLEQGLLWVTGEAEEDFTCMEFVEEDLEQVAGRFVRYHCCGMYYPKEDRDQRESLLYSAPAYIDDEIALQAKDA